MTSLQPPKQNNYKKNQKIPISIVPFRACKVTQLKLFFFKSLKKFKGEKDFLNVRVYKITQKSLTNVV
jgi:pimeloyl-CoA synthetase